MSNTYSISVSKSQDLAIGYAILDPDFMINNFIHETARRATDDICQVAYSKYMETGKPIPKTKEEIVIEAFDFGWVQKLSDTV